MDQSYAPTLCVLLALTLSGIVGCSDAPPGDPSLATPSEPMFAIDNCNGNKVEIVSKPSGTGPGSDHVAQAEFTGTARYGGHSCAAMGNWTWTSSSSQVVEVVDYFPSQLQTASTVQLRGGTASGTAWIKARAYDPDLGIGSEKADSFQVTNSTTVASIDLNRSSVNLTGANTVKVNAKRLNEFGIALSGTVSFALNPSGIASMTSTGTNEVTLQKIAPGTATLTASASGKSKSIQVNAFDAYTVQISGPVNHCLSSPPPVYTADAQGGNGGPYPYQWWVNGVSQYGSSNSSTFQWTGATAGTHEIVVKVYNVAADTLTSHIHSYC